LFAYSPQYVRLYNVQESVEGNVVAATGSTSRPPQPLNGRVVTRVCNIEPSKGPIVSIFTWLWDLITFWN